MTPARSMALMRFQHGVLDRPNAVGDLLHRLAGVALQFAQDLQAGGIGLKILFHGYFWEWFSHSRP